MLLEEHFDNKIALFLKSHPPFIETPPTNKFQTIFQPSPPPPPPYYFNQPFLTIGDPRIPQEPDFLQTYGSCAAISQIVSTFIIDQIEKKIITKLFFHF